MYVGDVQKTDLAIVGLFAFVAFTREHVAQSGVVPAGVVDFYIVFLVYFFCLAYEVCTLGDLLYDFLIHLAPVAHYTRLNLTAPEQRGKTLRLILIEKCQRRHPLPRSELDCLNYLLFCDIKRHKKLTGIRLR